MCGRTGTPSDFRNRHGSSGGIFNEMRLVGTLLPLYRVGAAVYGETLEYIDGAVVSKPFVFGNGCKLGSFVSSYQTTPRASLPEASRPTRTLSTLSSVNGVWTKAFLRGEFETFTSRSRATATVASAKSRYAGYYVQGGITPTEKFTLAAEYNSTTNRINLPSPYKTFDLKLGDDIAVGATWDTSAQIAFKLEGHKAEGYQFDVPVPTLVLPTTPPFNAPGARRVQ